MTELSTIVRIIGIGARISSAITPTLAARWLERLFLTPSRRPISPRKARWLATALKSTVQFDDSRSMPVYSWGSGPTVLLVHGWSGRGSQMRPLADPLVQRGFRVVAFDAPGHGEAGGRMTGLPEMATAIELVAAHVGPVHAIMAHSMGAAATTFALSRGMAVERAVYISPPENPGGYLYPVARLLGFGEEVARRAQKRIERRFSFQFDDTRGTLLAPRLEVPMLLVHDGDDPEVPLEEGSRLAEAWPGSELMTTKGLGHHRILRTRSVIEAAVDFLGQPDQPGWSGPFEAERARPALTA